MRLLIMLRKCRYKGIEYRYVPYDVINIACCALSLNISQGCLRYDSNIVSSLMCVHINKEASNYNLWVLQ